MPLPEDTLGEKEWMEMRWQGAPRTPLRVVGASDQPVSAPFLVCEGCHEWTPHQRPVDAVPSSSGPRGLGVDDVWNCDVCRARRVWGTR